MKNLLIGTSLSFCIKDIIEGKVDIDDVLYIITGTRIENEEDFGKVLLHYVEAYWGKDAYPAALIMWTLYHEGRLYQPKVHGEECGLIRMGTWITPKMINDLFHEKELIQRKLWEVDDALEKIERMKDGWK